MSKLKIYNQAFISNNCSEIINKDQGFSSFIMVMILLMLGLLLITSFSNIVLFWEKSYIKTHIYYRHYNQAQSAIEWARTQAWQEPTPNWQCRLLAQYQLTACIKQATHTSVSFVIIKGESNQIKLYQLATFEKGLLTPQPGKWLDYCPNNWNKDCE